MGNVRRIAAIGLLVVLANAQAQRVRVLEVRPGVSSDTTELDCKHAKGKDANGRDRSCEVTVLVRPSTSEEVTTYGSKCVVIVPIQTIRLKKDVPLNFTLARSSMTDASTYRFVKSQAQVDYYGIKWISTNPKSDEMIPVGLNSDGTVASWLAGKRYTGDYEPLVEWYSGNVVVDTCKGIDPKIANDG